MTFEKYYDLIRSALECSDAEQFISEVGYPDWAPDDVYRFIDDLQNIYDVAHMTINDMRAAAGLTQRQLADRFDIPKRTIENWSIRSCPPYVRLMIADLLGLITVNRVAEAED